MKRPIAIILCLMTVFTLCACKLTVEKDRPDDFAGEYTPTSATDRQDLSHRLIATAESVADKNLLIEARIDAKLTVGERVFDLGAKLDVLKRPAPVKVPSDVKDAIPEDILSLIPEEYLSYLPDGGAVDAPDPDGEAQTAVGAKDNYTFFTFGAYHGGSYVVEEFHIYYQEAENTTYYKEVATLELKNELTSAERKYKKTDHAFDAFGFAGGEGYDFLSGQTVDVATSLYAVAAVVAAADGEKTAVFKSGEDKIKIVFNFDEAENGYDGMAYYVYFKEDFFKVKVVFITATEQGDRETDKVVEISSVDDEIVFPSDLDEYEEKADAPSNENGD